MVVHRFIFFATLSTSAKMSRAIDNIIAPLISKGGKYDGKVKVIFRPQVQPWHSSSTLTHEAGLAVLRVSPEQFRPFSRLVCIWHLTPKQPSSGILSSVYCLPSDVVVLDELRI